MYGVSVNTERFRHQVLQPYAEVYFEKYSFGTPCNPELTKLIFLVVTEV